MIKGTQIVTGLQEDPYRSDGRDQDGEAKEPHPCVVGKCYRVEIEADEHDYYDAYNTDQGCGADRYVAAIYEETEDHSQHDEEKRDHRCGEVRLKGCALTHHACGSSCTECVSNDGSECSNYQKQCKITEDDEQALSSTAHGTGNNFADGLAFVADRGKERAKIVHAAEEDTTDHYPEEDGDPAEDCRLNRAVDRARAGDRGEVVSHQNGCFSGDVVHSVFEFMSGGLALG